MNSINFEKSRKKITMSYDRGRVTQRREMKIFQMEEKTKGRTKIERRKEGKRFFTRLGKKNPSRVQLFLKRGGNLAHISFLKRFSVPAWHNPCPISKILGRS